MVLSTKCKQQVAPPFVWNFWIIMASLINCIGIPNLSQNCYLSSIIQLLKCCTPACDVVLNHYEQCLDFSCPTIKLLNNKIFKVFTIFVYLHVCTIHIASTFCLLKLTINSSKIFMYYTEGFSSLHSTTNFHIPLIIVLLFYV